MMPWARNSQVDRKNLLECPWGVTTRQADRPLPLSPLADWNLAQPRFLNAAVARARGVWQDSQN